MIKQRINKSSDIEKAVSWVRNNMEKAIGKRQWIDVILESNASPSVIQRSKFHAMLNDVNRQGVGQIGLTHLDMRKYDYDECKTLMVKWFLTEKKLSGDELKRSVNPRVILDPMYGDAVYLRPSTKDFDTALISEFVEFIYSVGAHLGVRWSEPALKEYQSYRELNK